MKVMYTFNLRIAISNVYAFSAYAFLLLCWSQQQIVSHTFSDCTFIVLISQNPYILFFTLQSLDGYECCVKLLALETLGSRTSDLRLIWVHSQNDDGKMSIPTDLSAKNQRFHVFTILTHTQRSCCAVYEWALWDLVWLRIFTVIFSWFC